MNGFIRLAASLAGLLVGLPADAQDIRRPASAEQAVERQRDEVRDSVTRPCRSEADEETIVVCGQLVESGGAFDGGSAFIPPSRFAAPAKGSWFEIRRGPVSISCCSVDGSRGTGAGLSLRIRF